MTPSPTEADLVADRLPSSSDEVIVAASGLALAYRKHRVIDSLDLAVRRGSITALFGHNGAGKTTILRGLAGFLRPATGTVSFQGQDVSRLRAPQRAKLGLRYVPQTHGVFPDLTVRENLDVGCLRGQPLDLDQTLSVFPDLEGKLESKAGTLSGGQRQMLAISMALIGEPSLLLLDEPSTGLAPVLVDQVLDALARLHESTGLTIVVVEQNIAKTQRIATDVVVVQLGEIVFSGTPQELDEHPDVTSLL